MVAKLELIEVCQPIQRVLEQLMALWVPVLPVHTCKTSVSIYIHYVYDYGMKYYMAHPVIRF